jgi:hypothetical protein
MGGGCGKSQTQPSCALGLELVYGCNSICFSRYKKGRAPPRLADRATIVKKSALSIYIVNRIIVIQSITVVKADIDGAS